MNVCTAFSTTAQSLVFDLREKIEQGEFAGKDAASLQTLEALLYFTGGNIL